MNAIARLSRSLPVRAVVVAAALLAALAATSATAQEKGAKPPPDRMCITCHQRMSFKAPPAEGEARRVHVTVDEFRAPAHAEIGCTSCHSDIVKVPHRKDVERGPVICADCHNRHPQITLLDAMGDKVLESGRPLSQMLTCGNCHDTDFIAGRSDHANAGEAQLYEGERPHPWIAGPGAYGGWDPLRYHADTLDADGNVDPERWLERYGARHVGGGPVDEFVEMNCLLCHSDIDDHSARADAIAAGQHEWANTAPLAQRDVLSWSAEAGWQWNPDAFRENGKLKFGTLEIIDPDEQKCGQCHGQVATDLDAPLVLEPDRERRVITERTGLIYSGQHISESGLNIEGKEGLDRPFDLHLARGLTCVNCHYSLNNPVYYQREPEDRPEHMVFDPRRPGISEYLRQPLHQFAKGTSFQGLAAEQSRETMRRCASCHDATAVHEWLPYYERHFNSLACESCHIPEVYGPALRTIDWTMVDATGEPLRQYRGTDAADPAAPDALLAGYRPVMLPRRDADGDFKLAPFNVVTSWYWVKDGERPLTVDELRSALLSGDGHHPDLVAALDRDGDGRLAGDELRADSPERLEAVKGRLQAAGLGPLAMLSDATPFTLNHNVVGGGFATRECRHCHGADSVLGAPILLSSYMPGGQRPTPDEHPNVAYEGKLAFGDDGSVSGIPDASLSGFYIIGLDDVPWIDWLGILMVIGVTLGVSVHGLGRFVAGRRRRSEGHGLPRQRVYLYDVYERFWHWLQALVILLLLFTGLVIHKPHLFDAFDFAWMVNVHNVLGFVLIANAALALFYNLVSGEFQQYLPEPKDFFGRAIMQAMYYSRGIFAGEPHPFEKTKDSKLNPLQQVTYFGILNVLLPAQVITGILIWGMQRWPEIANSLGGLPVLAPLHTLVAWTFAAFIIMHVYLTTASGHKPLDGIKSMITGYEEVEKHGAPAGDGAAEPAGDTPAPEARGAG